RAVVSWSVLGCGGIDASLVAPSRGNYSATHDDTRTRSTANRCRAHVSRIQNFLLLSDTSMGDDQKTIEKGTHGNQSTGPSGSPAPTSRLATALETDRPVTIPIGRLAGQLNCSIGGCARHQAGTTLTGNAADLGCYEQPRRTRRSAAKTVNRRSKARMTRRREGEQRRRRVPPIGPLSTAIRLGTRAGPRDSGGVAGPARRRTAHTLCRMGRQAGRHQTQHGSGDP